MTPLEPTKDLIEQELELFDKEAEDFCDDLTYTWVLNFLKESLTRISDQTIEKCLEVFGSAEIEVMADDPDSIMPCHKKTTIGEKYPKLLAQCKQSITNTGDK